MGDTEQVILTKNPLHDAIRYGWKEKPNGCFNEGNGHCGE